jgi:hypothetical protein
MRFHHVIATIIVLIVIAGTAALVGQVTLIRLQRSIEFSVGEFRP